MVEGVKPLFVGELVLRLTSSKGSADSGAVFFFGDKIKNVEESA